MALESFTRAFWPLGSALAAFWAALAFGLAEITSRQQLAALVAVGSLVLLALLALGIRRFRWPTEAAARARIDATLPGRPLASLRDTPAMGRDDPGAQAVWAAHLARMRRIAALARPVRADLRLASRDPWALRLMALVLLIAALLFARDPRFETVSAALRPAPGAAVAAGPSFEGWAEPPAYTGHPTLYLPEVAGDAPLAVPEGTVVTLRVYGEPDRFGLEESVSGVDGGASLAEAAPGIAAAEFPVAASGTVSLRRGWRAARGVVLHHGAGPAAGDRRHRRHRAGARPGETQARLRGARRLRHYRGAGGDRARPRGGGAALRARGRSRAAAVARGRPAAAAFRRRRRDRGDAGRGLLQASLRRPAGDGAADAPRTPAGQTGESAPVSDVLPMRSFYDPVAAALIEQRRDLLWSAANARRVTQVLRAVTNRPEATEVSPRAYLVVRTAIRRLAAAEEAGAVPQVRDEVAEALWQAAVQIEDGALGDAAERLARAQERLQQALRDNAPDEEIARLMDELRQATRDYMEQMARNAQENGEQQQAQIPPGQMITQDQIQELMDRIQELSEQGRKAEAEALLEMLQQMLENMQMMMGSNPGGPGENGQGQQSMQGLADALREQQGLADDSFQQLQREFQRNRPNGGQGQPGQAGRPGPGRRAGPARASRRTRRWPSARRRCAS